MPTALFPTMNAAVRARRATRPSAIPFLKRFTVFNAAQCDGLPDDLVAVPPPVPEGLIIPEVEALIRATGADLRLGGDKAFYAPAHDYIQLPRPESYFEPINWHRTALHELGIVATVIVGGAAFCAEEA